MSGLRELINTGWGKLIACGGAIIAFAIVAYAVFSVLGPSDIAKLSREGVFMDASTGKPFNYKIRAGDKMPILAPSGKQTGYPAEMCWWTKDGKPRSEPYPVLLNQYSGKQEPTFCPDCGRLVVAANPPAMPGEKPPPTEAEQKSRTSAGGIEANR